MNNFKLFLTFVLGAAAGSAGTYFLLKKKFQTEAEAEIQEVRDYYHNTEQNAKVDTDDPAEVQTHSSTYEKSSLDADRHAKAQKNMEKAPPEDYTKYYEPQDVVVSEPDEPHESPIKLINYKDPYPISPNEFGEEPSYTEMHLVLHPNGAITDEETGEEIEDLLGLIGTAWEGSIGEYELNTVRVRNERLSIDIEIVQELPKAVEKPTVIVAANTARTSSRKPHEV